MVTGQAVSRPRTDEQGAGETTHICIQPDHTGTGAEGPTHASTRPIGRVPLWTKACCRSGRSNAEHRGITERHRVGLGPCKCPGEPLHNLGMREAAAGPTLWLKT